MPSAFPGSRHLLFTSSILLLCKSKHTPFVICRPRKITILNPKCHCFNHPKNVPRKSQISLATGCPRHNPWEKREATMALDVCGTLNVPLLRSS